MSLYTDWRHGRGFGVHSPWAYALITEALRNPCTYYNEQTARRLMGTRAEARAAGAVFRIIARERPSRVTVMGPQEWHSVAALAGSLTPGGQRMVLVADDRSDVAEILSAAGDGGIVVIVRPACHADALVREIIAKAPRGRAFVLDTLRTLVIVNLRPDLPDQYLRARF